MKLLVRILIVVSSVALLSSSAYAAGNGAACKADTKTYCSDMKPDDRHIVQCLKEHSKQITAACNTVVNKKLAAAAAKNNKGKGKNAGKATDTAYH